MTLRAAALAVVALLAVPGLAAAHPERPTDFPDPAKGEVPTYRSKGPSHVVCKPDSRTRISSIYKGRGPKTTRLRKKRLAILERCRYEHIQAAVDASKSGDRILIMPGVYREEPSRAVSTTTRRAGSSRTPGTATAPTRPTRST